MWQNYTYSDVFLGLSFFRYKRIGIIGAIMVVRSMAKKRFFIVLSYFLGLKICSFRAVVIRMVENYSWELVIWGWMFLPHCTQWICFNPNNWLQGILLTMCQSLNSSSEVWSLYIYVFRKKYNYYMPEASKTNLGGSYIYIL